MLLQAASIAQLPMISCKLLRTQLMPAIAVPPCFAHYQHGYQPDRYTLCNMDGNIQLKDCTRADNAC